MNITDPIRRNARIAANTLAVVRPDGTPVSYRELDRAIDLCATRALELGLGPGRIVAAMLSDSYRMLVTVLGIARVGAAIAPATLPDDKLDLCLVEPGATVHPRVRTVQLSSDWWEDRGGALPPIPIHRDGKMLFRIFSSSGTTGVPKFAAVSHEMMLERVYLRSLVARVPPQPRMACSISGGTNIGFGTFLQALWQRGSVVLISQQDNVGSVLERHRPNVLVTAPVTLQQIVATIPPIAGPMRGLETVISAGSALSDGLYDAARQRLCPYVVSLYGSVEAGAIASAPKNALYRRAGAAGYVLPGLEMQAVDERGQALPAGTEGLIRIRGAPCIDGYFGDPAASASVFRDGWFYPGDTGSISADGLLTLGARASEVINSGGNKISPQVIEELLMSVTGIRDAAAFGIADPMGVTRVWAAIATYNNAPPDHSALEAACRQHLSSSAPTMFIQVPQIPRNENGKIMRDELRRIAMTAMQRQRPTQ